MIEKYSLLFKEIQPQVDFFSLRVMRMNQEYLAVRQNILQPLVVDEDVGAMVTVYHKNGVGYSSTCDLSVLGLKRAVQSALSWAESNQNHTICSFSDIKFEAHQGEYSSKIQKPWDSMPLSEKIDMLQSVSQNLKTNDRIVDWSTSLTHNNTESLLISNHGAQIFQKLSYLGPYQEVIASDGNDTIRRSMGYDLAKQKGLELLDEIDFTNSPYKLAEEALALLGAPNCPEGKMDIILDPGQMALQIHESIGHPLEQDRILGDERNYAGTSFVTQDMVGSYQYGSPLMNVSYDPSNPAQLASFAYDDDGAKAKKEYIIKEGILKRTLGGTISAFRSGLPPVANSRATHWNRPPIDRMANLNLEPGNSTLDEMISSVSKGVLMKTNISWSIDDSRNKFQFGTEWGQLIEDGKLTKVVKKPGYRGISANFWRSLDMVGNSDSYKVCSIQNCGKGEPNQTMTVGHASPYALFRNIDVFGGE